MSHDLYSKNIEINFNGNAKNIKIKKLELKYFLKIKIFKWNLNFGSIANHI